MIHWEEQDATADNNKRQQRREEEELYTRLAILSPFLQERDGLVRVTQHESQGHSRFLS